MTIANIHSTAVIEPGAKLGSNVTVEPYAIIKGTVTLEDHVVVKSHAYIDGNTTIGEGTVIYPSACIGTKTQDRKFQGETTYVKIGKHCEIREFVTINSSTQENNVVEVGDNCLIMAYCHIAHNCTIGQGVIMSNNATLAGHVQIEDYAIIGGMTAIHQFSRIGSYAMVGGMSRITHDIPPYTIGAGSPYRFGGLNLIGLKRHGFSLETRRYLSQAFKCVYRSGLKLTEALEQIERTLPPLPELFHWLHFCRSTQRGLTGFQGRHLSKDVDLEEDPLYLEESLEEN